jgi:hypothetical protein
VLNNLNNAKKTYGTSQERLATQGRNRETEHIHFLRDKHYNKCNQDWKIN